MGWKRMKRFFWIVSLVLLFAVCPLIEKSQIGASEAGWHDRTEANVSFRITIVNDINTFNSRLKPSQGFSCVLNFLQKKILFDTGVDGATLLGNMAEMDIDPREIDLVIFSHNHPDHVGGLHGFLERNVGATIYMPGSFAKKAEEIARLAGAKWIEINEPREIFPNLFTTGILGREIREQSLVLKTSNGLVVITGCAHPGLITILQRAKEIGQDEIYLLLGGFHLKEHSASSIESIIQKIRDLGVKKVAPCHCSGNLARELFRQHYGQDFIDIGVGKIVS